MKRRNLSETDMKDFHKTIGSLCVMIVAMVDTAAAHVPYFERNDFDEQRPFEVPKGIKQSIAVYSWLEPSARAGSGDVDLYTFDLTEPTRVYLEVIVPVCTEYEDFAPWFALVGPGLPAPTMDLPFEIPPGYGALVEENTTPGDPRDTFYEPFGGKFYYAGPVFDQVVDTPGNYYLYYWDQYGFGGDYVAVLGAEEIWERSDIVRALVLTPAIRRDRELHVECEQPGSRADPSAR
jgi:hypothetical protein